jgi:hypothetical protein
LRQRNASAAEPAKSGFAFVQANEKCILKARSRRKAAQLISDATDLLNALAVVEAPDIAPEVPALAREVPELP